MANALSISRLILALPFAWLMLRPDMTSSIWAALLLCIAIASDLLDGRIARRSGTESALGRILDHGADFSFVTLGLSAAAARGALPWLLPGLISIAFLQYVIDSYIVHREPQLRMSRLGSLNGILYFFPLGGDILARWFLPFLALPAYWLAWLLVLTTLLSIGDRLLALRRSPPTAPGARAAERSSRSPH